MFRDALGFLSNFYPAPIDIWGSRWPTAEHAYQAAKFTDVKKQEAIRAHPALGLKKLARQWPIERAGWDYMKVDIMRAILEAKFAQYPYLLARLDKVPDEQLVEENYWHDNFWGICMCKKCPGKGKNWLGRLLYEIKHRR